MELSIYGLENEIIFDNLHVNVLEIKNKKMFTKVLCFLNDKCNEITQSNEIVLKDNNKELDMSKNIYIVFDVFNIDYNSKKILNKLYALISQNINLLQDYELEEIILRFRNFLIKEINELPFEFTMKSDISIEETLKLFSLRIDENYYVGPIEKIEFVIDIVKTLDIAKVLVVPNLKLYLTNEELIEIYKYAKYNEINLLVIENNVSEILLEYEKKNVIDENFDDFVQKL